MRAEGHHVLAVTEMERSIPDAEVLRRANQQAVLLLTADKDFGEMGFRQRLLATGVVLLRLAGLSPGAKASIVATIIRDHAHQLVVFVSLADPEVLEFLSNSPVQ
jgi:predicted nuclease of predicted toxin-antitoxin system